MNYYLLAWPADDPTGARASERPTFVPDGDEPHEDDYRDLGETDGLDDIGRAELDAATREDARIDDGDDYEAAWPF